MGTSNKPAEPATVARICARRGIPEQAPSLIREGASLDEIRKRADAASEIRARVSAAISGGMVSEARANKMAELAIQRGQTADQVSRFLADAAVDEQTPDDAVQSRITADAGGDQQSVADGWRRAAERVRLQYVDG